MSLPRSEIIAFCNLFAERQDIRATATGSAKGAAIAGLAAFVGALIGGPLGLFIGKSLSYKAEMKFRCYQVRPLELFSVE
jgi:hypothetical protein